MGFESKKKKQNNQSRNVSQDGFLKFPGSRYFVHSYSDGGRYPYPIPIYENQVEIEVGWASYLSLLKLSSPDEPIG